MDKRNCASRPVTEWRNLLGDREYLVKLHTAQKKLAAGFDRTGALDFQRSPSEYEARVAQTATLEGLLSAAENVEKGLHPGMLTVGNNRESTLATWYWRLQEGS